MFPIVMLAAMLVTASCGTLVVPGQPNPSDVNRPRAAFSSAAPAFANATAVTVGAGDTVYALSRRHDVAMRSIIEANGLQPPYFLRVGQRLVLPRQPTHIVAPGETLYALARQYGGNVHEIARNNGLTPPYTIFPSQRLIVPSGMPPAPRKPVRSEINTATVATPSSPSAPQAKVVAKPSAPASQRVPSVAPPPPKASGKGFLWPVEGTILSSFGAKSKGLFNDGVNIAAPRGTPIKAAETGVVAYTGNELKGFGNLILIKHEGGWVTAYAHADTITVKRGQIVKRGQSIATVGATGGVTKPQLHFEIRRGRQAVDPAKKLPRRSA